MEHTNQRRTVSAVAKKIFEENGYMIFIICFFTAFHFFIRPDYWDDAVYSKALEKFQYNLVEYTQYRYTMGSSRIFIEICLSVIAALPDMIWKIVDIFMIALLFLQLDYFAESALDICRKERREVVALLLCAFPFSSMASAGWMATTTNYLWVVALGMYVINRAVKVAKYQKSLSTVETVSMFLAVLYSASHELMAAILFLVLAAAMILYWRNGQKRISPVLLLSLCIVIGLLVYIACCPGNRQRILSDTENWMPEYFQLSVTDKIRMGMVTAFLHFVSIPSAVFFLFSCCCFIGTCCSTKKWYKRAVALLPAVIDCIWSTCYFISYFAGKNVMTYQAPLPLLGGADTLEQIALLFSLMVWLGSACCAICWSFPEKIRRWHCILLLGIGCAPELVLGFTPTVVASMLRTVIYLYMAMILVILCVWDAIYEKIKKNRGVYIFLIAVSGMGIVLNAVQIIRHILVYG